MLHPLLGMRFGATYWVDLCASALLVADTVLSIDLLEFLG